jgi:hypothetical protein
MDPFSSDIIAAGRRNDMADEAEQSRLARAARECPDGERPVPRPQRRTVRARRAATA